MDRYKLKGEVLNVLNAHPIDKVTCLSYGNLAGHYQIKSKYFPESVKKEFELYECSPQGQTNYVNIEFNNSDDGPHIDLLYTSSRAGYDRSTALGYIPAEYIRGIALMLRKQDGTETFIVDGPGYKEPDIKVYLAPSYEDAYKFLETHKNIAATVEAEYGILDICGYQSVRGMYYTLSHHGDMTDHCAPCIGDKGVTRFGSLSDGDIVLISHIDLDTIGGIMQLKGCKPKQRIYLGIGDNQQWDPFWYSAAYVDVNGPHKECDLPKTAVDDLHAYHAWAQSRRVIYKETTNVTDVIKEHEEQIKEILSREVYIEKDGDGRPIKRVKARTAESEKAVIEGREWSERMTVEIENRLIEEDKYVRVFITDGPYCSASYHSLAQDIVVPATATLNTKTGAITIAFEDDGKKASAEKIVQELWGPGAGGRDGIAGSPRGQKMTREDLDKAVIKIRKTLEKQGSKDDNKSSLFSAVNVS